MTLTEVEGIEGEEGDFTVHVKQHPRYVDMDKCIACGECARKCPKKVRDYNYNEGIGHRKAIFVRYPQAVPLKYRIDADNCIQLQKGKCGACQSICPTGAIKFDDVESSRDLRVGSIILAPGSRIFNPSGVRTWGFGVFPNVITSLQFERYLSASGPTEGHLIRPSDNKPVKKIAFLQCVGSRDYNKSGHGYCSSICCMYAIKETLIAMEHVPELDASIFFMDMRTHGKDFERYYNHARDKGVKFRRCRVHSLEPGEREGDIYLRYITDEGKQVAEDFDLVVLSVGMETADEGAELCQRLGVKLNHNRFMDTSCMTPVNTSRPGIYACGTIVGPKNIPHSVMQASAAASAASGQLSQSRFSLTKAKVFPPERDVRGEEPRVGVFVCHCGSNIAGVIDVQALADYAAGLPGVVFVERNLFTCSQDTQELISQKIKEQGLNRIVVAACTPRTHEPLFKETLKAAGLNEYLFEMANIRNQASWVHAGEPLAATDKAKDLVRMAVAKVALLAPMPPLSVAVKQAALVVGGGMAGMTAALGLAEQGYEVHLVDKASRLGGNSMHLFKTWKNEPIQDQVQKVLSQVGSNQRIKVFVNSQVTQAEGFVGNFRSTISGPAGETVVEHGAAILATGAKAHKPEEYAYGQSRRVFTALEFDKLHLLQDDRIKSGKNFIFIQCVGSREPSRPYCSRVCCTHSVQAAMALKQENPERGVFILYRDLRTYGQREELYTKARELGVVFINYEMHIKPQVKVLSDERLEVLVWDHVLHQPFSLDADVLILATAIVTHPEVSQLANLYKVPVDSDGFFQEAHVKLRPVEFSTDGLFLAGLAHYPKPIEESISQAKAAVSRAVTVLSKTRIDLDSIKAEVDEAACDGCALCLDVCPYHAIGLEELEPAPKRHVVVNSAQCKGCGCCQATCPKNAVNVAGFSYDQLAAQIAAALA
jgi:heterodisulfide reductase subunit A